jgi:ABC-type uncharacterized transport system YnjBCD ATPase subunit
MSSVETMMEGLFRLMLALTFLQGIAEVHSRCGVNLTVANVTSRPLQRVTVNDALHFGAVCNDRSPSIYYISKAASIKNWIIYLEGGIGCGNMLECNFRYKQRPDLMSSKPYPKIIQGRDIFNSDPKDNPDYWNSNMVLIPYCTSDLWVGNSVWDPALGNDTFRFNLSATYNQFVFRGIAVFRTIVKELLKEGLDMAVDVVLAGSSAGGIGAMNHAGWLQSKLSRNTKLSAILDSSWFINFKGDLEAKFDFPYVEKNMNFPSHLPCKNVSLVGYPCCISTPCMLSKPREHYLDFPDIPVFVIFSQYDLFILASTLQRLENETEDVKMLETFRTITEYGVVMKIRLGDTALHASKMSYFVPSCLQHIYLAPSDLREVGGLLRTKTDSSSRDIEHSTGTNEFRSAIEPEIWSKISLRKGNSSSTVSLQCAIHEWNQYLRGSRSSITSYPLRYSDDCFGARCNSQCPETVMLGQLGQTLPSIFKWVVVGMVLTINVLCLFYKIIMMWKKRVLLRGYTEYISRREQKVRSDKMSLCPAEKAIGIACLDLRYSVRLSHDAIHQARELEKRRLAAEEEARCLMGSADTEDKLHRIRVKHPSKRGALFDLVCASGWTRVAGAQTPEERTDESARILSSVSKKCEFPDGGMDFFAFQGRNSPINYKRMDSLHAACNSSLDSLREKTILNGISSYFNPGEMVAIMGPSGCGKTTFLDLLTGRRRTGRKQGEVLVNGIPFECVREWYIKHSGYVLQLAVPYYEELTVRQNLLLAAFMRLPSSFSAEQRFQRVECVIEQIGLSLVKDTVVGGSTGAGLSGGQVVPVLFRTTSFLCHDPLSRNGVWL